MAQRQLTQTLMIQHEQAARSTQQQAAAPGADGIDMKILHVRAVFLESLAILADRDDTAMSTDEIGTGAYPLREDGGENAGFSCLAVEDSFA